MGTGNKSEGFVSLVIQLTHSNLTRSNMEAGFSLAARKSCQAGFLPVARNYLGPIGAWPWVFPACAIKLACLLDSFRRLFPLHHHHFSLRLHVRWL